MSGTTVMMHRPRVSPASKRSWSRLCRWLVAELRALRAANTVLEEWCAWVEREARGVLEQSTFATLEAAPMVDTESLSHALDALSAKWRGEEPPHPRNRPNPRRPLIRTLKPRTEQPSRP